jgi:hypothetical protein
VRIKDRLKMIGDRKEHVDCAEGSGICGNVHLIADCINMKDRFAGGENAPVNAIGEGKVRGKAVVRGGRRKTRQSWRGGKCFGGCNAEEQT